MKHLNASCFPGQQEPVAAECWTPWQVAAHRQHTGNIRIVRAKSQCAEERQRGALAAQSNAMSRSVHNDEGLARFAAVGAAVQAAQTAMWV